MTWFRIDDSFYSHPKVARLFDGDRGGEAVAMWTLAGSWCANQLTDGFVPNGQLKRFGVDASVAAELVRVALWEQGDGGYWFHDFLDYNPSRSQVLADREAGVRRSLLSRARRGRDKRVSHTRLSAETEPESRPGLGPVSPDPDPDPDPRREDQLRTALRADFSPPVGPVPAAIRARTVVSNDVLPDSEAFPLETGDPALVALREFQQALLNIANAHPLEGWRHWWRLIGQKPEAERAAVIRTLRGSTWATRRWRRCSPEHVHRFWHLYSVGEEPGRDAERPSDPGEHRPARRAGPSEVASAAEYEQDARHWSGARAAGGRSRDKP